MDWLSAEIEKDKKQIEENQLQFDKHYPVYQETIEQYLKQEAYEELVLFFQSSSVIQIAQMDNTMAILNIAVSIYKIEKDENVPDKILDGLHTIHEVEYKYLESKFFMWRLQFKQRKKRILDYILRNKMSIPYIKTLIQTAAFEKVDMAFEIAMLFKKENYVGKAAAMLNYMYEIGGSQELLFCEMADICFQAQQYQAAAECIGKILNPSGLLEEYKKRWGMKDG